MEKNKLNYIDTPGLIKVIFDYPFDVGIMDMYFPVVFSGLENMGMVKVTRLEGVQIYDKSKILREDSSGDKKEIKKLELPDGGKIKPEIVGFGKDNNPAFHHIISERGISSYPWFYCKVEVVFCVNDIKSAWSNRENSTFINNTVMELFNKFLLVYRDATTDIYNKYLNKDVDIVLYKELYVSEFSEEEKLLPITKILNNEFLANRVFKPFFNFPSDSSGNPNPFPFVQGSISTPLKNNVRKKNIEQDKALIFLQKITVPASIPIFNQVLLSSMERLVMDNDPRMTIVDLDTAVEMTIAHYLFGFLTEEGKTIEEVVNLFDDEAETSQKLGNKGYLTTTNRLNRLEEFFNKKLVLASKPAIIFKETQEWKDWHKLVRKRRNAAVHAWEQFDDTAARESFGASQKFIRYLQKVGDELLVKKV